MAGLTSFTPKFVYNGNAYMPKSRLWKEVSLATGSVDFI